MLSRVRRTTIWMAVFVMCVSPLVAAQPDRLDESPDSLADARAMALDGRRAEALALLDIYLAGHPDDAEARTLYGTILSWQGEYTEARAHLQLVLNRYPTHGDALPAMANVELWSENPDRAEALATVGLTAHPTHPSLHITRARALWSLSREPEALEAVNHILQLDPGNEAALSLRRALQDTQRFWRADVVYAYDAFSDSREGWLESRYSVTRQTHVGSVTGRFSRARRFGATDHQLEVDAYPRFREGTYAYLSGAVTPSPSLFPSYRLGAELYQSLGRGTEVSAGYRRLQFASPVNIYTGSVTKYRGNWMVTGRVWVTPHTIGPSTSVHAIVRRYRADGVGYIGLRYGRGTYRDEVRSLTDVTRLSSDTYAAELVLPLSTFELWVSTTVSREGRPEQSDLWQVSTSSGLGVRF